MTSLSYRRGVRRRLAPGPAPPRMPLARSLGRLVARVPWGRGRAPSDPEAEALLGRRAAGAALGALLLGSSGTGARALAGAVLGAWAGWRAGRALHERERRRAAADVRRALPYALDRLATCVLAGMSVERALRLLARQTPGALGAALTDGVRALDLGLARERAYARIAERAGSDELHALVRGLARAERFGTSVSEALVAQATELRARARAAAEAEARTAPVKMVFPLVFCFLPAFVLLTVVPIAISAIRTIGGL